MQFALRSSPLMYGLLIAGLVCSLVSLGAVLSAYHLVFDLLAQFRIQYVVLISGLLCLALGLRRYGIALTLAFCLSVHLFDVGKSQYPLASVIGIDGPVIRVMNSNLRASNTQHAVHIQYIRQIDPDVIVFQEYNKAWEQALTSSLVEYKHTVSESLNGPFGIALFSKFPLEKLGSTGLENARRPYVDVAVSLADSTFRIIGTHPPPPVSEQLYLERNSMLKAMAHSTKNQSIPIVLLGDLNITPWSSHFREFINNGELFDGRRGFGVLPTWPAGFYPLQIPIDHVIVNDCVQVLELKTSDGLSSDHRTIWADLQVR
ncbi:endonuclease/exonuclease/phosphatase family protein [bacterium]|nr:endonuclease/exonuclease/phosphatase family protein [bacterium]